MRKRILYLFLVFGLLLPAASDVQGRAVAYTAAEQKEEAMHKVALQDAFDLSYD